MLAIWFLLICEFEVVSISKIVLGFLIFDAEMSSFACILLQFRRVSFQNKLNSESGGI